jgi:diguanylate cyclase (GGDEF)-like protein
MKAGQPGGGSASRQGRERAAREQAARLANLRVAVASYGLDLALLAGWWYLGAAQGRVVVVYAGVALAAVLVTWAMMASGRNLALRDPSMTLWQTGLAYAVQVGGMWLAPQLGAQFMLTTFIVAAFSAQVMTVRQFALSWVFVAGLSALALGLGGAGLVFPDASPAERALAWVVFVSVLGRVVFLSVRVGALRDALMRRNEALRTSLARIEHLANVDELTGAWNRRALLGMLEDEALRAARQPAPFSLVILDLDRFKTVNDRFGHPVGDAVLRRFAAVTQRSVRAVDRLGRWGGEEFALLLPGTTLEGARIIAERVRESVAAAPWGEEAPGLTLTVSGGLAEHRPGEGIDSLVKRADVALYAAKAGGRNRIVCGDAPA